MLAVTLREWAFLTAGTAAGVKVIVLIALIPGLLSLRLNRIAWALTAAGLSFAMGAAALVVYFLDFTLPTLWWWPPFMVNVASISLALTWFRDRIIDPLATVVADAKSDDS